MPAPAPSPTNAHQLIHPDAPLIYGSNGTLLGLGSYPFGQDVIQMQEAHFRQFRVKM